MHASEHFYVESISPLPSPPWMQCGNTALMFALDNGHRDIVYLIDQVMRWTAFVCFVVWCVCAKCARRLLTIFGLFWHLPQALILPLSLLTPSHAMCAAQTNVCWGVSKWSASAVVACHPLHVRTVQYPAHPDCGHGDVTAVSVFPREAGAT